MDGKKIVERKKRSPILAPLLSILAPGLGQIYNGQLVKGIIVFLILFLLSVILSLTGIQFRFYGMIFVYALLISIELFIAGDGLFVALKKKDIILRSYNKWYFYVLFVILTFGISVATDKFVDPAKSYRNASGAMTPTLMNGDRIIVNLEHYKINEIRRGDIIVFKYPGDPKKDFIKRVMAVGGDKIESKNKVIFINGEKVVEPYVQHVFNGFYPACSDLMAGEGNPCYRDNFGPLTVPKNKVFVIGDNRDQSFDSRYWGFLDVKAIRGKALYIYWSWDTVSENVRWNRIGRNIE